MHAALYRHESWQTKAPPAELQAHPEDTHAWQPQRKQPTGSQPRPHLPEPKKTAIKCRIRWLSHSSHVRRLAGLRCAASKPHAFTGSHHARHDWPRSCTSPGPPSPSQQKRADGSVRRASVSLQPASRVCLLTGGCCACLFERSNSTWGFSSALHAAARGATSL